MIPAERLGAADEFEPRDPAPDARTHPSGFRTHQSSRRSSRDDPAVGLIAASARLEPNTGG